MQFITLFFYTYVLRSSSDIDTLGHTLTPIFSVDCILSSIFQRHTNDIKCQSNSSLVFLVFTWHDSSFAGTWLALVSYHLLCIVHALTNSVFSPFFQFSLQSDFFISYFILLGYTGPIIIIETCDVKKLMMSFYFFVMDKSHSSALYNWHVDVTRDSCKVICLLFHTSFSLPNSLLLYLSLCGSLYCSTHSRPHNRSLFQSQLLFLQFVIFTV